MIVVEHDVVGSEVDAVNTPVDYANDDATILADDEAAVLAHNENSVLVDCDVAATNLVTPIVVRRKGHKRSKVWSEYLIIDAINTIDGKERAQCIHCKTASFLSNSHYGTKNLIDHLLACGQYRENSSSNGTRNTFDQTYYRDLLARAIIRHGYAFSWVEHEGNRKIHTYLNNQVRTISRNTAKADCLKLHKKMNVQLMETLQNIPGRISFTSDMWTSCQTEGYLCLTAHYVDADWKLTSRVLNFVHLEAPHTGHAMYFVVSKLLREWGIEHKAFSITLDNASSNDKMQKYLKDSLNRKNILFADGNYLHVRCAAHILNLIVKDGLKMIAISIEKIRESVKHVKWSEGRKQLFKECVTEAGISETKALWFDVPTRWNSTYFMLDRALMYRDAFKEMFDKDPSYIHFPTEKEWDKVEKIRDVLEPFCDITTLFSGTDYPTANLYFENVWKINILIKELTVSKDVDIKKMGDEMLLKFNKYWCRKEDEGDYRTLFAMAAILDPRYKKQFLLFCYNRLLLTELEAETALAKVVTKLQDLLTQYVSISNDGIISDEASSMSMTSAVKSTNRKRKADLLLAFDAQQAVYNGGLKTKLDSYLEDPILDRNIHLNILDFWKENEKKYGELSHLARDILSVPLTTVASESTFSIGGRILNKWRSCYLPENIEALITSRSWMYGYEANEEEEEFIGSQVVWDGKNAKK